MKNIEKGTKDITTEQLEAWVREALEPDQISSAKGNLGRLTLAGRTVILLWGLRFYVLFMILMIVFQVWNALHAGH
jgi:hypothetical protein